MLTDARTGIRIGLDLSREFYVGKVIDHPDPRYRGAIVYDDPTEIVEVAESDHDICRMLTRYIATRGGDSQLVDVVRANKPDAPLDERVFSQ